MDDFGEKEAKESQNFKVKYQSSQFHVPLGF